MEDLGGVDALVANARTLAAMTRAAAGALGLPLVAPKDHGDALTALYPPAGIDSGAIVKGLKAEFASTVAGGQGPWKGKILRVAHLGYYDATDTLGLLATLEVVLRRLGHRFPPGAGVAAAEAEYLEQKPGVMSYRILVLDGITERGMQLLKAEGWTIDSRKSMPPSELAAMVAPYHAIMIRSGSHITAEVLDAAANLRVIGRPGVGVDNVDLDAATRRGVVVMNSPGGNLVSTAELTLALLLAVARNIPQADAAMKAGKWERQAFAGVELQGKRIGVIGLGRIGREVAARCRKLGMEVVGFDPFVSQAVAETLGVRLLSLDEVLRGSDFLTLHTTLTSESRHLLGKEALAKVKPGVRIVNAARGELIDEAALLQALESGRVAAAALDVHAHEPPTDWTLARHPRVVATPHVGAATAEAQERVGTDIAVQVRDFLKGGVIQNAVNFFSLSGDVYDQVKPAIDLGDRLGLFLGQVCPGSLERIEIGLYGDFRDLDVKPILAAAVAAPCAPTVRRDHPGELAVGGAGAGDRGGGVHLVRAPGLRQPDGRPAQDERARLLGGGHLFGRAPAAWWTWTASRWTPSPRAACSWCATTTPRAWSGTSAPCSGPGPSTSPA